MRPLNNIPQHGSPSCFNVLWMTVNDNDKESDKWLNQNETTKAPTTVILRDSIIKNVYGSAITKSVNHNKHVVVKHFSGAKIEVWNM